MFKTQQLVMKKLGEKLKDARELLNFSVQDICEKTKIPISYIKRLEDSNYKDLPADVYVFGYLKKMAKVLKLNPDDLIRAYKEEKQPTSIFYKNKPVKIVNFKKKSPIITPSRITLILVLLVICLIVGYFWHELIFLFVSPKIKLMYPSSDIAIEKNNIEIYGWVNPYNRLMINGKEVYVDDDGYFSAKVELEKGLNIVNIIARDRAGRTDTIIRKIMVTK